MIRKFHKQIRLHPVIYKDKHNVCSITICTENQQPIFLEDKFTRECMDFIYDYSKEFNIPFYIFKFMPDHLHLVVSPERQINCRATGDGGAGVYPPPAKSIIDIVRELKGQITRIAWRHGLQGRIWQKSFYDHFLRKEETIEIVIKYILDNARRKGLVNDWTEYSYIGSTVYSMDDFKNL